MVCPPLLFIDNRSGNMCSIWQLVMKLWCFVDSGTNNISNTDAKFLSISWSNTIGPNNYLCYGAATSGRTFELPRMRLDFDS